MRKRSNSQANANSSRRSVLSRRHRTFDVVLYVMQMDMQALLQIAGGEGFPDYWPEDNSRVHEGGQLFTVKEEVASRRFKDLPHWQLNLARKAAVELQQHLQGEFGEGIANDIEAVCDRIDGWVDVLAKHGARSLDDLFYQATVAFDWRRAVHVPARAAASSTEDESEEEGTADEAETSDEHLDPLQTFDIIRKVFASAMDLSPRAFNAGR